MTDSYYATLRKVETAMRELHQDLEERNRLASTNSLTAKKDTVIRNQMKSLQKLVEQLLEEVEKYEKEQSQNSLNNRELAMRRKKAYDIRNDFEQLQEKVSMIHRKKASKYDDDFDQKGKFEQRYKVDEMGERQVKDLTKKLHEEQEHLIDAIGDTVSSIKDGQVSMRKELKYQNEELLGDIEDGIDRNVEKTQKNNDRVGKLLHSTSNCTYYTIIAGLVALLFVQLIIL